MAVVESSRMGRARGLRGGWVGVDAGDVADVVEDVTVIRVELFALRARQRRDRRYRVPPMGRR